MYCTLKHHMSRKTYTTFNNMEDQVAVNSRMYSYVLPSLDDMTENNMMEPCMDLRATPTRYTRMQTIAQHKVPVVPPGTYDKYVQSNANGRNYSGGTFDGFAENVDSETVLRNQVVPLHRSDLHSYVPSTGSDMYVTQQASLSNRVPGAPTKQFHDLFEEQSFRSHNPNVLSGGKDVFSNHTREQRNL